MIVVDASVLLPALVDEATSGDQARGRLTGEPLMAPELIDLEVASAVRRLLHTGALLARRADRALDDLVDLPMRRVSHRPLLARCWGLRGNLSMYDASYVALAEMSSSTLVTADRRLSMAPGIRCEVELIGSDE